MPRELHLTQCSSSVSAIGHIPKQSAASQNGQGSERTHSPSLESCFVLAQLSRRCGSTCSHSISLYIYIHTCGKCPIIFVPSYSHSLRSCSLFFFFSCANNECTHLSVPAVLGNRAGRKNEGTDQRSIYLYTHSVVKARCCKSTRGAISWPQAEVYRTSVKRTHASVASRQSLGTVTKNKNIRAFRARKGCACCLRQAVVYDSTYFYSRNVTVDAADITFSSYAPSSVLPQRHIEWFRNNMKEFRRPFRSNCVYGLR